MTEAVALYDYHTNKEGQLALKRDDRITNISKVTSTTTTLLISVHDNEVCSTLPVTIVMQYMYSL